MDDLEIVGMPQPMTHLHQQRDALRHRKGTSAGFVFAERLALEEGHDQIEQPIRGLAQPENGADVGMVQPRRDGRPRGGAARPRPDRGTGGEAES